jgi:hypothetical protein
MPVLNVTYELTDTYAGEANYTWVQRGVVAADSDNTSHTIVRRAKSAAGLSGIRCRKEDYGDMIALYPQGMNMVLFINIG